MISWKGIGSVKRQLIKRRRVIYLYNFIKQFQHLCLNYFVVVKYCGIYISRNTKLVSDILCFTLVLYRCDQVNHEPVTELTQKKNNNPHKNRIKKKKKEQDSGIQ